MKTINVKGPIITNGEKWIYDWFEEDSTCPNDVIGELPADGSPINVVINSGGGYVSQGNEIYTALMSYEGSVTVEIIEAGSAASVIAMAGRPSRITPVGRVMIHNVSMAARGDYNTMDKFSKVLKKADRSIAAAYHLKTGLPEEEILEMMNEETWMTAKEAKEKGFVDEIMFQEEGTKLVASASNMIPANIIEKMQSMKNNNGIGHEYDFDARIEKVVESVLEKRAEKNNNNGNSEGEPNPRERFFFC